MAGDRVVAALERERAPAEQPLQHRDRFVEALDARRGRVVHDARLLVVGAHPTGADPELEPPVGQQVEGSHLLRQQHGVVPG